jgi:hypothetical protein
MGAERGRVVGEKEVRTRVEVAGDLMAQARQLVVLYMQT